MKNYADLGGYHPSRTVLQNTRKLDPIMCFIIHKCVVKHVICLSLGKSGHSCKAMRGLAVIFQEQFSTVEF